MRPDAPRWRDGQAVVGKGPPPAAELRAAEQQVAQRRVPEGQVRQLVRRSLREWVRPPVHARAQRLAAPRAAQPSHHDPGGHAPPPHPPWRQVGWARAWTVFRSMAPQERVVAARGLREPPTQRAAPSESALLFAASTIASTSRQQVR